MPPANEIVSRKRSRTPYFNPDADDAANYGNIGTIISHEIGHGFDDQGSRYDGDGKLESWWTEEDYAKFKERTAALVEQYNAYVPVGLDPKSHVNGELTLGENIGDLAGMSIALKAYRLALKKPGH